MENREGYKKTELGWIPDEWAVKQIEDICDVKGGKRLPKGENLVDEDTGYPYIRVADMYMGGIKTDALKYVPLSSISKIKNYTISKDDLFISVAGTLGIVGKIPADLDGANLTENADKLTKILTNRMFLFYVLQSDIIQNVIHQEATINALPKLAIQKIKNFIIPLPPLPEQQKIASILTTVDDKISSIEAQIQQTEQLKKGLMAKLLTEGIGHTEFKDTEIGRIPNGWNIKLIKDICEIKGRIGYRGYTQKDLVQYGEGALAIGASQINERNKLDFSNPIYISWDKYYESPEIMCRIDDILIVQRGSIGKVAIIDSIPEKATINPSMIVLKNIKINNKYLFYVFSSLKGNKCLLDLISTTSIPMISQKQVSYIKLPLPPLQEQQQIASILSSVDDKLDVLQSKKTSYSTLKKGLMAKLLTGQMRVRI